MPRILPALALVLLSACSDGVDEARAATGSFLDVGRRAASPALLACPPAVTAAELSRVAAALELRGCDPHTISVTDEALWPFETGPFVAHVECGEHDLVIALRRVSKIRCGLASSGHAVTLVCVEDASGANRKLLFEVPPDRLE